MYITKDELKTHIRLNHLEMIAGADDTIITAAVDAAVAEVKGYLTRYDRENIFSRQGDQRNALLVSFVKDISIYHLINFCNAGVSYEAKEKRYERAIDWLKAVQKGHVVPDLPLMTEPGGGEEKYPPFYVKGNPKRMNHF